MSTYAIEKTTVSNAEIAMLIRMGRGPDASFRGKQAAQRVSSELGMALTVIASMIWLMNTWFVVAHI